MEGGTQHVVLRRQMLLPLWDSAQCACHGRGRLPACRQLESLRSTHPAGEEGVAPDRGSSSRMREGRLTSSMPTVEEAGGGSWMAKIGRTMSVVSRSHISLAGKQPYLDAAASVHTPTLPVSSACNPPCHPTTHW